jgi:ABC-type dipeptide/oligopeptide/nickel transport system permease subunit
MTVRTLAVKREAASPWRRLREGEAARALRKMLRDPVTCAALALLTLLIIAAVAAPLLAPDDPNEIDAFNTLHGPSAGHWLGVDENGRDVLSRLIYGTRVSLSVGLIAVGVALVVGVPLGLVSGYFGSWTDTVIMRLMDAILAFPSLILALAFVVLLGQGILQLMIAIGITSIPIYARLVRAQVLSLKTLDYVGAARSMGASTSRILFRHILPNTTAPIIVQGSLGIAFAILAEAGLSFLGLGVKPPAPAWGGMLQRAIPQIYRAPYLSIFPGLAIFLTVLALNNVGDALRDTLDPRLRGKLGDQRR